MYVVLLPHVCSSGGLKQSSYLLGVFKEPSTVSTWKVLRMYLDVRLDGYKGALMRMQLSTHMCGVQGA